MLKELDIIDKKLLYELDLDSRQSYLQLAKKIKAPKETVNFRLKRLIHEGYIRSFGTVVYVPRLNHYFYRLCYKFHKTTPQEYRAIIKFIEEFPRTAWFGVFEGPYDLGFLIIAKSIYDLDEFLIPFRNQFGDYIRIQEIHVLTSAHRFNLKFFYPEAPRYVDNQYPEEMFEPDVDDKDYQLIKIMSENCRTPLLEIAKALNLDSSTVLHRLKVLKEKKILGTNSLIVNFEKFGIQHLQVYFVLRNNEAINKLIGFFSQQPRAIYANKMIGKYDLSVEMAVKNNFELRQILDSLMEKHSSEIIDHDTFFIVKEYQTNWYPKGAE